jgi:acetate kinase
MIDDVLVVDGGSHSLRLVVVTVEGRRATRVVDAAPDSSEARDALSGFLDQVGRVAAVGHRVVHGGDRVVRATVVDDRLLGELRAAAPLAPLHMPAALAAIRMTRERLPDLPHVVAVDTAFHSTMPETARTYALPLQWRHDYGLRRYGFHGLSYRYALRRGAELLGRDPAGLSAVLAHLGGGASVCAVQDGHSVWTSMGMTPLEGLVMSTRSGSVDPGMLLDLIGRHGLGVDEVRAGLERRSGLLGLSGGRSGDTRQLVPLAAAGDTAARLALDVFVFRIRQEIAAAAACLDRLDALVITGEIGADQPEIREAVCAGLPVLGLRGGLEPVVDRDRVVSADDAAVPVVVVVTGEDLQVAAETRNVLGRHGGSATG